MNITSFEVQFLEKCKMESIQIEKFNFNEDQQLLEVELKYEFDLIPIPDKFEINRINFSGKYVSGVIKEENFNRFIETFYV